MDFFILHDLLCGSTCNHFSSMLTGTRSNVHNIVCRTHRILIMFHDNDRISKITQMLQCSEQFVIILWCRPILGSSRI